MNRINHRLPQGLEHVCTQPVIQKTEGGAFIEQAGQIMHGIPSVPVFIRLDHKRYICSHQFRVRDNRIEQHPVKRIEVFKHCFDPGQVNDRPGHGVPGLSIVQISIFDLGHFTDVAPKAQAVHRRIVVQFLEPQIDGGALSGHRALGHDVVPCGVVGGDGRVG